MKDIRGRINYPIFPVILLIERWRYNGRGN
nr:MAG TPA: hypothetical protein [Caudoviricetes sp.]